VDLTEPDAPHGFTLQTREATVQWMRRWLLGIDDVVREIDELPAPMDDKLLGKLSDGDWTEQELQCTTEGQVLLTPGEKSVFRLNEEIERNGHAEPASRGHQLPEMRPPNLPGLPHPHGRLDGLGVAVTDPPRATSREVEDCILRAKQDQYSWRYPLKSMALWVVSR